MAVNATAVWRVRPSGSNTNGYDAAISATGMVVSVVIVGYLFP